MRLETTAREEYEEESERETYMTRKERKFSFCQLALSLSPRVATAIASTTRGVMNGLDRAADGPEQIGAGAVVAVV